MVTTSPCNAGNAGSILGWATKIPQTVGQLSLSSANKDPEQPKEKKERAREGAKQHGNMLSVYPGADKAGSPMWTWQTSRRRSLNTVISFPLPRMDPTGQDGWGPSLTQALSSDLQGVLCGKQGLGEADENLGPGRAAVISPWLPPHTPQTPGMGATHLPILYSSGL